MTKRDRGFVTISWRRVVEGLQPEPQTLVPPTSGQWCGALDAGAGLAGIGQLSSSPLKKETKHCLYANLLRKICAFGFYFGILIWS